MVRQWTASTTNTTTAYTNNGPTAGTVRVVFTNDGRDGAGRDRNVIVESVAVGGQVFDPVDVRSRGIWNGVDCGEGFRQSRFLACNGWFEFLVEAAPQPTGRFTVRLRGTTGSELASISVDGTEFGPYEVPSDWTEIELPLTGGSIATIRVNFLNDAFVNGQDRNLIVDWLSLNGQRFEAETLVARGVWDGSRCDVEKVHGSGYLACRGWVELRPG